ncbi:transcriptional regulator [Streptomyces sp. NWU339]|uniref:helix-turn-helix domain-containing protein n=1 Tax=Streptomyces sp. NWU339 TaxID=2185284 RepID=UPI000D677068|nr:helix-turn-helix transcriptional regulator [Streptomyces sp. NWU339]PWI04701.1 transcriptional regulator [Streptomyces sp. NWU339]
MTSAHQAAPETNADDAAGGHGIHVTLDKVLEDRGVTVSELSRRTGISRVNLTKLKNGRASGIIWTTLGAICKALDCQPGDLMAYTPEPQ